MKKITLIIFCVFTVLIIFFSVFGGMIRQTLYVSVTTAKIKLYNVEGLNKILRGVPNEAVHNDGGVYVWVLLESDDIGEKYYYVEKIFVEILDQGNIYTGIRGIQDDTIVIITSSAELKQSTRVKIDGEYDY